MRPKARVAFAVAAAGLAMFCVAGVGAITDRIQEWTIPLTVVGGTLIVIGLAAGVADRRR